MLPAFLDDMARRRWQWGECDCTMVVADWIEAVTGKDPLKEYRGKYSSPDEARETARRAGGFLPTLGRLFDEAGLARTQSPETGDVAAISVPVNFRHYMPVVGAILAIRNGDLWVVKGNAGLVGRSDFEMLMGWRL